jgi:hypothetical protein
MLRRSSLFALAASAALGLAALNPVIASAAPGGHGMHGSGHRMHGGGGHRMHGGGHHFRHVRHHRPHWHGHYVRYHRPIWYAAAPVTYATYAVRPAVAGPCTCLTKEYTQEGAVVFKDRCTNELAINPPPPPPQQTGMAEQPQVSYAPQLAR